MNFSWFRNYFGDDRGPDIDYEENLGESEKMNRNEVKEEFSNFPINDPFENIEGRYRDIFQRVEDMFNSMLTFDPFDEFPKHHEYTPNETNPRSLMLKEPEFEDCKPPCLSPFEENELPILIDTDIDDKVAQEGLFPDKGFQEKHMPHNFSFKKFSSIRTVHLPDGTMEEHRTMSDSKGNKISTVRRSIGDQSYEVTTHSDSQGLKEKHENLTNIDESDLFDFEKRWKNIKHRKVYEPIVDFPLKPGTPVLSVPPGDSSYLSLFKRFFGF